MTILDQVELRQPENLLVNIGANDGLYRTAFEARPFSGPACAESDRSYRSARENNRYVDDLDGFRCPNVKIKTFIDKIYLEDIRKLVARLQAVPGLQRVFINGLALPSQPANLISTNGKNYISALLNYGPLDRTELDKADATMRQVNQNMKAILAEANQSATGPRFVFIDTAALLARYDYKNCLIRAEADCAKYQFTIDHHKFGIGQDQVMDNRPTEAIGQSGAQIGYAVPRITEGGLFSLDNMHLSTTGYEILAQAVWLTMTDVPGYIQTAVAKDCGRRTGSLPGACIPLLTSPGYGFADAGRRQFTLARVIGEREVGNLRVLRTIIGRQDAD